MNIKTLIASFALVAATSSAALADHEPQYPVAVQGRGSLQLGAHVEIGTPQYRQDRYDGNRYDGNGYSDEDSYYESERYERRYQPRRRWQDRFEARGFNAVTGPMRQNGAREDIWVHGMTASTIQLRGTGRSGYVQQVAFEFGPGTTPQVVEVNRWVGPNEALNIDLAGGVRSLTRIAVFANGGASYQVLAR